MSTAIQTGTHVTQQDVQSEGLLYFCLVKCTLGPVFVVGNSWHPVTWQSLQDKAVLSRTEMFYRVWIASKTNILNWPTKNLTEGQVSPFPGFAEDNTYRGGHKTVSISQFMHQYHFQMLLNYNIYNLLNTRWILIEKFQAYNQVLQGWDLANLTRTKLSYS